MFRFKHPFTCMVCGPTQSGKTYFVTELVRTAKELIHPPPTRIVWHYGQRTKDVKELEERYGVVLREGLDFVEGFNNYVEEEEQTLVVIDDLMTEAGGAKDVSDLFTKGSHHENTSVILVVQNLFHQGKAMRTISLNAQYIVLLKNPRDVAQVRYLGQQLFPGKTRFFVDAYKQATQRPHGYLLVDLTQTTSDEKRVLSDVLPTEGGGYYYVPKY